MSSLPSGVIAACPGSPALRGKLAPSCCSGAVIHSLARLSARPIVANLSASRPKEMLATGPAATSAACPICAPLAVFQRCTTPPVDPVRRLPSDAKARPTFGAPVGWKARSIRRAAASIKTTRPSSRPAATRLPSGEKAIDLPGLPSVSFPAGTLESIRQSEPAGRGCCSQLSIQVEGDRLRTGQADQLSDEPRAPSRPPQLHRPVQRRDCEYAPVG